jgi:hypothetical protein
MLFGKQFLVGQIRTGLATDGHLGVRNSMSLKISQSNSATAAMVPITTPVMSRARGIRGLAALVGQCWQS